MEERNRVTMFYDISGKYNNNCLAMLSRDTMIFMKLLNFGNKDLTFRTVTFFMERAFFLDAFFFSSRYISVDV